MKRALAPILILVSLSGCKWLGAVVTPTHAIDARTAGPLMLDVIEQHDESVQRDPVLVAAEKEQAIRSSALVRDIVEAAQGAPKQ